MFRSITKILVFLVSAIFLLVVATTILLPSPIDAASWRPPAAPATGVGTFYEANQKLKQAELFAVGRIYGPEDVAIDSDGSMYAGTQDGKIVRVYPDDRLELLAETGGRPLGLHFDAGGNLIVCDAYKGLLSITKEGAIEVLADSAEGVPFVFADDLDIASDGKIYFTDASSKWNQANYMLDLLETRPYGRFLVYDPATRETTVLMRDMYFPNGVALSQNEDFVLINETWRYRVLRYWLQGPKAGTHDVFIDNLPGFPDGISSNRRGQFWLAMPTPRNPAIDRAHPYPWLKNLMAALPESLRPKPVEYGFVLGLDESAKVTHNLHDTDGVHLQEITSVEEHGGYIYFGSLHNDRIGRLALD